VLEAGAEQRAASVGRCGVAGDVGRVGVGSEHLIEREPARLDMDLVMRQEQRPVDVEQYEPVRQTGTTVSTASRSERT
jgi:hypothetical protein